MGAVLTRRVEAGSDVLNKSIIRELAAHRGDPVVTSFYLDVDGRRFPRPIDLDPKIEHLVRVARQSGAVLGEEALRSVDGDVARIADWLSQGLERSRTRGVAAFSCSAEGFFRTLTLPVSVPDGVSLDHHPHVAPLVVVLQEATPCLVVLVDHERTRLVWIEGGEVTERAGPIDELPRQVDTGVEIGSFARHDEEAARRHLRRVADELTEEIRRSSPKHLLLGGPAAAELEHHLRQDEARRILSRLDVAMTAPRDEVAAGARRLLEELERRREADLIHEIFERVGAGATVGLSGTLDALAERRVATLVVGRRLQASGVRCRDCGRLDVAVESCPRCGGPLEAVPDLVEAAIDDGLGGGATIELVDVPELDAAGGIGALERY